MAIEIVMPKLAMAMSEGTVLEWKFEQGVHVDVGQVIVEIETEKVTYEIEATTNGYLNIVTMPGETVPVEVVIGLLAESEEELLALSDSEKADEQKRDDLE